MEKAFLAPEIDGRAWTSAMAENINEVAANTDCAGTDSVVPSVAFVGDNRIAAADISILATVTLGFLTEVFFILKP